MRRPATCRAAEPVLTGGVEPWTEVPLRGGFRIVTAERIEPGAELRQARIEVHDRLPEGHEEPLFLRRTGPLLSGNGWECNEDKEEEDDRRTRPHCLRHGSNLSSG